MPTLPESGVRLVIDLSEFQSGVETAKRLASELDNLTPVVRIEAEFDESSIELPESGEISLEIDVTQTGDSIENLPADDESVDFTVEVIEEGDDLSDLPLSDETVSFTVDEQVTGDVEEVAALPFEDTSVTAEVVADVKPADETALKTLSAVETLKNLKIVETVWNIAGNALELIKQFKSFAVDPLLSLEEAVARVDAQTGGAIKNADELISGIFYDDLGQSIDQVTDLVIKAQQMGAPLDEAARAALTFTHTFTDENPEQVLDTLNSLVINGLAPNFEAAGDMLVTAFQNGANRGGDLLTTVEKNATAIKDLGLDGKEGLGLITEGLDAGFTSAESVVNSLTKVKQNIQNAAGSDTSDVTKTLDLLGIANPAETGEAWSVDFIASVISGIQNAPVSDSEKMAMFSNLVGGKIGAKEFSSFMAIDPANAAAIFANVTGAAETAATAIDNSLSGAIDDFKLAAQKAATEFLSSEQIDLPGKIALLKEGLQNGLNTLSEGGSLGEALTVALKPIGFDDEFQGLESMLGNFVIAILQVVSALQAIDPSQWGAKEGTDRLISNLAANQLAFDLTVGNSDEIAGEINTAISRGVSPETIAATVGGAVNDLIEAGTPAAAQSLLDALKKSQEDANMDVQLTASGSLMNHEPTITGQQFEELQKQVTAAQEAADNAADPIDTLTESWDTFTASATTASEPTVKLGTGVAGVGNQMVIAQPKVNRLKTAIDTTGQAAAQAYGPVNNAGSSLYTVAGGASNATDNLLAMNEALNIIVATANDVAGAADVLANAPRPSGPTTNGSGGGGPATATPDANASGGIFSGMSWVGEEGRELISSDTDLAVLNNRTSEDFIAAMMSYIPGSSFGGGAGNAFTVNNYNNVANMAVADRLGYSTAQNVRGIAASRN